MYSTSHRRCTRQSYSVFFVALSVVMAGCSQSDRPKLGLVTGTVTLDGQPLKNVEIAFIPPDGRPSYADSDDQGRYELVYIRDIMGAKVGTHKIHVRSGQVDNDKLQPVEVVAGNNVINIECPRKVKAPGAKEEPEPET